MTEFLGMILHVGDPDVYMDLESNAHILPVGQMHFAMISKTVRRRADPFGNEVVGLIK